MARTFADVESVLIAWLMANADPAIEFVPEVPPDLGEIGETRNPVVQLKRIGGAKKRPHLDYPTVDFDCYEYDREKASDLAEAVSALLMRDLPGSYLNRDGVRVSVTKVAEIAGVAERAYDNTAVVRFGFTIQAIVKSTPIPV